MFRKFVSLLLAVAMAASMALCASAEDLSCGTPWIDSELDGAITEGMTFDLKDDFAAAVNGDWVLQTEYAAGQSSAGTFTDVGLLTEEQVSGLMTGGNTGNDPYLAQIQSLYELYLDWDGRNAAGVSPLMPVLEKLEAIQTADDLTAFLTLPASERGFLTGPFLYDVESDLNDSSRYTVMVSNAQLTLGYADEYTELSESGQKLEDNLLPLFRRIMEKAGYSAERIEEIISNCFAFETEIAASIYTIEETGSPDYLSNINNPMTREELKEKEGNVPIVESILSCGVSEEDFTDAILINPGWLDALNAMYTDENAAGMRDCMILNYVTNFTDSLDREIWDADLEATNAMSGAATSKTAEQYATEYVKEHLAWPVARAYVDRYFTQEDKDRIYQLCADIVAEYRKMLEEEDFLSEETIAYAIEKLDNLQIFSLYPDDDQWPDTSALTFKSKAEGGTFWDAVTAITEYTLKSNLSKLGTTVDRTRWGEDALPTDVNASNNITANTITIYAAICQGNFYRSDMTTEELYASIGSVIGHEISHSFDTRGAQFDKTGSMVSWWTDEDYEKFQAKVQKMTDYYNAIIPWEGQQVHGSIVTGEATADIAGVKIMLRMAKSIDNFDYDLFFRTYARLWSEKATREVELNQLNNEHPLSYLRINVTLAQQPEFIETYGITEGDGMYIAPEDRIAIW